MNLETFVQSIVGRMAQGVRGNDPVSRMYVILLRRFGEHALSQWMAVSASGLQCTIHVHAQNGGRHACQSPAAGPCIGCGNLVCLAHAMAAPDDGSLFCKACVQRATGREWADPAPGPGPGGAADSEPTRGDDDRLRRHYLKVLGLDGDADLIEIKAQFKRLSRKFHPDVIRARAPDERARLESRYKAITAAYHWLIEHHREVA